VGGLAPAHVTQHHDGREDEGTGVHLVLPGVLGRGAVGGLEHGESVFIVDVGAGGDADAAHTGRQGVGDVVAVEVQGGDHVVLGRTREDLLQEGVGNHVFDHDAVGELAPGSAVDLHGAELFLGQLV